MLKVKNMPYPLIIIGAGASKGYIHEDREVANENLKYEPPLIDNLFDSRFNDIIKEFPEMNQLPEGVISAVRNRKGLEQFLFEREEKKIKNKERERELIAFRFYLHKLFKDISDKYGRRPDSNYGALVDEIKYRFGEGCIVNFNYDLLLEQILDIEGSTDSDSIDSYIKGEIKVIKAHGACNWVYVFHSPYRVEDKRFKRPYDFFLEDPDRFNKIVSDSDKGIYVRDNFLDTDYIETQENGTTYLLYPAIFLPLLKKETFICPKNHELSLEKALEITDRLLVIGWNAQDERLIKMIKEKVKNPIHLTIVTKNTNDTMLIEERLSSLPIIEIEHTSSGFGNFMGSEMCDKFFNS